LAEALIANRKAIELDPTFAHPYNNLAWLLASCPDAQYRDPVQAIALARKAIEIEPQNGGYINTLGVAYYRTGDWKSAIAALEKSMALRDGGDGLDWFFLAMSRWQLGDKEAAGTEYERAVKWMEANAPHNTELIRFRDEAAELLNVRERRQRTSATAPATATSPPRQN
jgi:tetratricopeptide (TPR) repeat protein